MSVMKYDLKSQGTLVKQDGKLYLFKRHFWGEEISTNDAISLLQSIADRELTLFETGLVLSTPISRGAPGRPFTGSITIDIVGMLIGGATPGNYLKFLKSLRRVVIGYAIRSRDDSVNYGDVNGADGFYDTDGKLIGQLSTTRKQEPGLETPILDPIDFVGGAIADIIGRGARLAVELTEEQLARYLAKEGIEEVGGMAGPKAAASAFWKAGEIEPKIFNDLERKTWTKTIKSRMKELGIPKDNIGIRGIPGESGEAFTPEGTIRGGNVRGKGISVHGSVMEDWEGFPEWNNASIPDRIDAVIAHEWMEFNELTHWETVELGVESKLPISKEAKDLLEVMRKKGLGWKALEDKTRPR